MANTTETVVVKLIVAADGALKALDQFDKGMTDAANASVKSGAAQDAFTQQLARQRAAMEAGVPVLKARAAAISAEEKAVQAALGRAEPLLRAQIAAERELGRVVAATSNMVVQGKMAEADALQALSVIEQAHVANINRVIAAERAAADAAQGSAAQIRGSAAALQAYNQSASRNAAESANIAMQFQDIAVSAQMGMSPMMIALQQGTQLSAIFNQMRNPLQALPAAFMAIINPVSLLTIGFVALAAVGIQWALDTFKGAEDATSALEGHDKMLDTLLVGYEDLRDAANEAVDAALKLPEGVVRSDLETSLKAQEDALDRIAKKATDLQERAASAYGIGRAQGFDSNLLDQLASLASFDISINSTKEELDAATVAARELYNTTDDPVIRQWADDFFQLSNQIRATQAVIGSSKAALDELNMTDLSGMESWVDISQDLSSWQDQLDAAARRAAAGITASMNAALQAAAGYGQAAGAANIYAGALQRLQSLIPAVAAAQQAQNTLAGAQIAYDQGVKSLGSLQDSGLSRDAYQARLDTLTAAYEEAKANVTGIAALDEQLSTLAGQNAIDALTGREQAIARVTQQYADQEAAIRATLNANADQADVDRLVAMNNEQLAIALANTNDQFDRTAASNAGKALNKIADAYDDITRKAQEFIEQQNLQAQGLGQTAETTARLRYEQDLLNDAAAKNIVLSDDQRTELLGLAADMAAAEEAARRMNEIYDFGKQVFTGFFGDIRKGIQEGKDLWTSLADAASNALDRIADKLMEQALSGLWDMLFGAVIGGIAGGMNGSILGAGNSTGGILNNALGGGPVRLGYNLPGFADGTNFAPGGMTWVGERGPELMRLPRGAEVFPANRSSAMTAANDNSSSVSVVNHISVAPGTGPEVAPAIAAEITREIKRQMPGGIKQYNRNPLRRPG